MATKRDRLRRLRERMEADSSLPLRAGATHLVFGEGNPDATLYLLGEAPGQAEDAQGRPFVGQAGRLLTRLLERSGLRREEVYLSNLVRFRPPRNRPPTSSEIAAFSPYVDEELSILQPALIVTLGRLATKKFIPGEKLTQAHGTLKTGSWQGKPVHIFPVYHPARHYATHTYAWPWRKTSKRYHLSLENFFPHKKIRKRWKEKISLVHSMLVKRPLVINVAASRATCC